MRIFLDTEFTSFEDARLLSLGLAAESGETCYFELEPGPATWTREGCSGFVRAIVLPLLTGPQVPQAAARETVLTFLRRFERPRIVTDFTGDWVLLKELLRPLPEDFLALEAHLFSSPLYEAYEFGGRRHHALVDAQALRWAYAAASASFAPGQSAAMAAAAG